VYYFLDLEEGKKVFENKILKFSNWFSRFDSPTNEKKKV
jgi:hypothetical protein